MNYDEWIARERRIRSKFLMAAPLTEGKRLYRICQECGEICLCHEEICPNCNGHIIVNRRVDDRIPTKELIRCRFRFERLVRAGETKS